LAGRENRPLCAPERLVLCRIVHMDFRELLYFECHRTPSFAVWLKGVIVQHIRIDNSAAR
jgi:hypothetical protein